MPVLHVKQVNATVADWATTGSVTVGNSTGGTVAVNASDIVHPSDWNSGHSVSLAASEIASLFNVEHRITQTTNAGGITFGLDNQIAFFEIFPPSTNIASSTLGNASWYFDPVQLPGALNSGQIRQAVLFGGGVSDSQPFGFRASTISSQSQGTVTRGQTVYNNLAFYLRGTGASSTRLEQQWTQQDTYIFSAGLSITGAGPINISYQQYMSIPVSWDGNGTNETYSTYSQSTAITGTTSSTQISAFSTHSSLTTQMAFITGGIFLPIGLNTRLSAGEWYIAHMMYILTAQSLSSGFSQWGNLQSMAKMVMPENVTLNTFKIMGNTATNAASVYLPGHGMYSSSNSGFLGNIPITDIRYAASNSSLNRVYWNFDQFTQ